MSDVDQDSKTEQASDKHVSEAKGRGQFAKSQEISVVIMLLAALGVFSMTIQTASQEVGALTAKIFGDLANIRLQLDTIPSQITDIVMVIAKVLGPVLGAAVLAAFLSGGLQSGFSLTPEALGIHFESLSLMAGFKRNFSKAVLVRASVDLLKLVSIGMVLWAAARGLFRDPMFSAPVEASYLGDFLRKATMAFLARIILALSVIAALSYWYEMIKSRKDLMMTKEEVKEEGKQAEGNTQVKGAMRRMARRMAQKQMLEKVATADVVITNPTHYAVALKYERGVDQAPMVLAKGENRMAMRIKALAAANGVPMVENKPVARMLFALGRVGEAIPSELYQAIAEILAFVYRTHRYYFYRLKSRRAEVPRLAP